MKKRSFLAVIFLYTLTINTGEVRKMTKKLLNNVTYFVCHGVMPGIGGFLMYRQGVYNNLEKYTTTFNISSENARNINWSHYYEHYSPGFYNDMQMTAGTLLLMYSGYSTVLALHTCKKLLNSYKNNIASLCEENNSINPQ